MQPGSSRAIAWSLVVVAAVLGGVLVMHALTHGGNGVAYVTGVELTLGALIGVALLTRLARRRVTLTSSISVAVVAATLAIVLPAWTRPSPVETGGLALPGTSAVESFGSSLLSSFRTADASGFAVYDAMSDSPINIIRGDVAVLGADGATAFVLDRDGTITSIGSGGEERWSVDVVTDDTEASLRPAAV